MKSSNELKPLWTPDPKNVLKTNLSLFGNKAAEKYGFKKEDAIIFKIGEFQSLKNLLSYN